MDFEKLKPFISEFVEYYEFDLDNSNGGRLHIVIEDGNLDDGFIYSFQGECRQAGDSFGYFLLTLISNFSEEERAILFENHWNFSALEKN